MPTIEAKWEFSEHDECWALVVGSHWLGYVLKLSDDSYAAFVGTGIDAPGIGYGKTLKDAQGAVEDELRPD